jgi:3-oxoacyl-[acyl-carrier-protein] synthase III
MNKHASWWGEPTPDATKVFNVVYFADAGGALVLETLDSREEADEKLKQYLANPKEELGKSSFFKGEDGEPSHRDIEKESCKPEKFHVSESWTQVYK